MKSTQMKNKIFLITLLLLVCMPLHAQKRGYTTVFQTHFSMTPLNGVDKVYPLGFHLTPGYRFNERWILSGELSADIALYDEQKYVSGGALGVVGEYAFLLREKRSISVALSGGHTIFADAWKYYYLDGGLRIRLGNSYYAPVFGIGIRWYGSKTDYFSSPCTAYLSVGFRIN